MTQIERPLRADAEQNRLKILVAAAEVFAERGLDATLDDVARRAGVGVGTVYRRFPDKESLIDALFHLRIAEVVEAAREISQNEDAWAGLGDFLQMCCGQQAKDRALKQVMVNDSRHLARTERIREELEPILNDLVDRAKAQGTLRPDADVRDIPVLMMMIGAAADYARDVNTEAWNRYFAIVLDGWRNSTENAPLPVAALTAEQLAKAMAHKGV